jgi:hypothetical protein
MSSPGPALLEWRSYAQFRDQHQLSATPVTARAPRPLQPVPLKKPTRIGLSGRALTAQPHLATSLVPRTQAHHCSLAFRSRSGRYCEPAFFLQLVGHFSVRTWTTLAPPASSRKYLDVFAFIFLNPS